MLKKQLEKDLKNLIQKLGYKLTDPLLHISKNPQFGDYSSNVALQLAKQKPLNVKHSALEIANNLVKKLQEIDYLEKVEVAGPGFINFYIKLPNLAADIEEILKQGRSYGNLEINKGKKARVEFVSANPTGPLHIGNARGGPLGDVIAAVLEKSGFTVLREYIDNDIGEQVKALGATIKASLSGEETTKLQYKGDYIKELADKLKDPIDNKTNEEIGHLATEILFDEIMQDVKDMGISFDEVVKESQLKLRANTIVEELKKRGVVKEKDKALWLAPSDEFLKDRETVIVKSDGGYTYFTSDIVYHKDKFESGVDLIIDIFGANHHGHIPRLQAAMSALNFDLSKLKFILYQYVRVKRGGEVVKMSKRAGNFITAREVLDEVGKDAFRFTMLSYAPETHLDFDLEVTKEKSNQNPVYFVQYAHARMVNILKKAGVEPNGQDLKLLGTKVEKELMKHLFELPSLVEELAGNLQVHLLTGYVTFLADLFHRFYEACPVLNADSKQTRQARLALVKASQITLANTLSLLGVSAPERM